MQAPTISAPEVSRAFTVTAALPTGMTARFELVTPERAREWLATRGPNRALSRMNVAVLSAQLKQGLWLPTHQGIAFSPDGRLNDGQHRLTAIVETGIPAVLLVVRGVSEEAFQVVDRQNPRRLADTLSVIGRSNHKLLAATVRRVYGLLFHDNIARSIARDTPEKRLTELEATTPALAASASWAAGKASKLRLIMHPTLGAAIHFVATKLWPNRDDFAFFAEGESLTRQMGDLRDRLAFDRMGKRAPGRAGRLNEAEVFCLVIRLLDKVAEGDQSRVIIGKDNNRYMEVVAGALREKLWGSSGIPAGMDAMDNGDSD